MEVRVFKLVLSFIEGVLKLPNENQAKYSFYKAKELGNLNSDLKYNWAKRIRLVFFEKIDAANLCDDLYLETLSKEKKTSLRNVYLTRKEKTLENA